MRYTIALLLLLTTLVWARPRDFSVVDAHALAATAEDESSLKNLATYLRQRRPETIWNPQVRFETRNLQGDEETAREIYRWITDRVRHDERAMAIKMTLRSGEHVLKRRYGVCHDFSSLFRDLARAAGLKAEYVVGTCWVEGRSENHAWNAVCIGGNWRLIDCTWGRRRDGSFEPKWFSITPEQFTETHFPLEEIHRGRDFLDFMKTMNPAHLNTLRRRMQPG